jgi:hypothetical protein
MNWADWYMLVIGVMGAAFGAYGIARAWRERGDADAWRRRRADAAAWHETREREPQKAVKSR